MPMPAITWMLHGGCQQLPGYINHCIIYLLSGSDIHCCKETSDLSLSDLVSNLLSVDD